MAQLSFLRQLREQLEQGDTDGSSKTKPWQQQTGGRRIPQETLVCEIYDPALLPTTAGSAVRSSAPTPVPPSDALPALQRLRDSILSILSPVLSAHLFHHSSFHLTPTLHPTPHLTASLHYGDCLDDQLLLTALLLRLTSALPRLCAHVEDDGGYYLLAEVADALPDWMAGGGERLANRVWLQGGALRVIDERLSPRPPATRAQAVQLLSGEVARGGQRVAVSPQLQAALERRLAEYPAGALQRSRHCVRCLLPVLAVRVLQADGSVVSGAANAFYARDMIDMRTANKLQTFLPRTHTGSSAPQSSSTAASSSAPPSSSRLVPYRVRFTRLLYAQLSSQPFALPRSVLAHPSLLPYASLPSSSPLSTALSLSYKLLAGLEMYYHNLVRRHTRHQQALQQQAAQQAKRKADRQAKKDLWQRRRPMSEEEVAAELRKGPQGEQMRARWLKYVANLQQLGWFTGVKREDDEERWRQRVMMGYAVFEEEEERLEEVERLNHTERTDLTVDEQRHLAVFEAVLKEASTENEEATAARVEGWPKFEELEADDDDGWMHLSEDGFERMMAEKEEAMKSASASEDMQPGEDGDDEEEDDGEAEADDEAARQQAQAIIDAMKSFMGSISGLEGAEVPKTGASLPIKPATAMMPAGAAHGTTQSDPAKAATASGADNAAQRQKRLMRVLECDDEKRMMSEVSKYEQQYGEGSFDRDLVASAGDMRLDDDDEVEAGAGTDKKRASEDEQAVNEEGDEDEDEDEGGEDVDGDDKLLFGGEQGNMRDYLAAMSKQLSSAGVGEEFERTATKESKGAGDVEEEEDENDDDEAGGVNADLNLLKNMLDSLTSQHGMAGPAGNLLGAMNVDTSMRKESGKSGKAGPDHSASNKQSH